MARVFKQVPQDADLNLAVFKFYTILLLYRVRGLKNEANLNNIICIYTASTFKDRSLPVPVATDCVYKGPPFCLFSNGLMQWWELGLNDRFVNFYEILKRNVVNKRDYWQLRFFMFLLYFYPRTVQFSRHCVHVALCRTQRRAMSS